MNRIRVTSTERLGGAGSIPIRGEIFLVFEDFFEFFKTFIEFYIFFMYIPIPFSAEFFDDF